MVELINHTSNSVFRKKSHTEGFPQIRSHILYPRAAVKPAVQLLQIQEVHPVAHSSACNFCRFFIYFSYLLYLGHLSLLGLQTKTRRQRNSSTFCTFNPETFMSSAASAFVHAIRKRSQKVPRVKSGTFWFPWMDSHDSSTI